MSCPARALPAFALLAILALLAHSRPAAAAGGAREVTGVEVETSGGTTRIVLGVTAKPKFVARMEAKGTRLVVDLSDTGVKGKPPTITDRAGIVGGVMVQEFEQGKRSTTRVLVTLLERAEFSVRATAGELVISVRPGSGETFDDGEVTRPPSASPVASGPTRVDEVRFEHQQDGDAIAIRTGAPLEFRQIRSRPGSTRLILSAATLPAELTRTLDVTAFGGPVKSVSSYASSSQAGIVVVEVEHSAESQGVVERSGASLLWRFSAPGRKAWSETGVGTDGGPARRVQTIHREAEIRMPDIDSGYAEQTLAPDHASGLTPAVLGQAAEQGGRFGGRRIDLDLKDADVHNVLRLLADVGRVNIITSDDVSGTVTIRMRNVPWDQALDVVLQSKGLGKIQQGNLIRVAPMSVLQKEREMEIARRQAEVKLAPIETRLLPVSYAEAAELQPRAAELLSARGSISVDPRTNLLIIRDVAGNLDQVEQLVRALDTQTPQVLVEARIIEATSRYLRDVGIQWGGDISFSAATGNPTGLAFPHTVGLVGGASDGNTPTAGLSPFTNSVANPNFAVNLPAAVGAGQGGSVGLAMGSVDNTVNVNLRLSAAEATGMVRILSSPRILTLDNQQARISQGTLIPFSQVSAQGVQTVFQEAKLQLLVQPHVTADGSVSLKVKVNRDEPDFNQTSARGDPTILKREAETTLLVQDGHTAVIGGVYTRSTGRNLDQVPFFGDIPILGLLFQRRRASDQRGEIVIFITPHIVNRAEALGQ